MSRKAADAVVERIVVERLRRPDASDLFTTERTTSAARARIDDLIVRREELAQLVADGLLPAAAARPKLTTIKEELLDLEARLTPTTIDPAVLVDPQRVWSSWTMPQRREVVRLLFDQVTIRHVGQRHGPRADPSRLAVHWRLAA
jgi:hypothetical protein